LQAEVKDQIGTACRQLRETQETLARFK
jgi:hypothetical protein